jgi:protein-L-isoaspartate(D-aspartate) O-methyltransferase
MIQATSVTGSGQADELRREMADGLVAEGWIKSPHVEAAFRSVPRHLFMPPGTPLETAYNGHRAPVLKTRDDGVNLSSVSGPWLQAKMIAQAGIGPGMRVIEIGRPAITRRCWPRSPGSTSLPSTSSLSSPAC